MKLIKGRNSVYEALRAGNTVDRIVILFENQNKPEFRAILELARKKRVRIQTVQKDFFEKEEHDHAQGILAYDVQENLSDISTILQNAEEFPMVVMLDHIEDPHNMGAIIRSAETLGAKAIIFAKDRQCQLTPAVMQASAGAANHIPLIRVTNLAQTLDKLKDAGFWIYGSDDQAATSIDTVRPNFPAVIMVSNEGKGISTLLAKKVDEVLKIPLTGKVSSLNVSVAAGILLNEFRRHLGK